ncbi:MAG: GGDEF domain-containing protein [Acidimicrobiia bacterium]|nr:GGDEF domain-containing protein [Acidimicrobiia bacterium]
MSIFPPVRTNFVVLELDRQSRPAPAAQPQQAQNVDVEVLRRSLDQALEMVREAVTALAGEQANAADTLAGSAERVEQIAKSDDIQSMQARLVEEVTRLKRISIERRTAWDRTVGEFQTRLTRLETQLDHTRREASVDPLTNVPNRRTFDRTCRDWLQPGRHGFVLAMADVDDFKRINDQYGHAVGDKLLVAVAETLGRSVRADDLVARVGGDEFAILAGGLTLAQAERRLGAVSKMVQEACGLVVPAGVRPSISIGLAECSAGDTLESLRQRADAALYEAKRNGKGRLATKESPLIRDLLNPR